MTTGLTTRHLFGFARGFKFGSHGADSDPVSPSVGSKTNISRSFSSCSLQKSQSPKRSIRRGASWGVLPNEPCESVKSCELKCPDIPRCRPKDSTSEKESRSPTTSTSSSTDEESVKIQKSILSAFLGTSNSSMDDGYDKSPSVDFTIPAESDFFTQDEGLKSRGLDDDLKRRLDSDTASESNTACNSPVTTASSSADLVELGSLHEDISPQGTNARVSKYLAITSRQTQLKNRRTG
eukprot:Blabericola_migrator_1__9637@NODE_526_length_7839_cov_99_241251_g402_i0_p4_GENE_NODE_526_length_7839_cov_99_241251_g402_i0NODE_526_length_7839_cov_99_241251_g402_i0_p4_ORF_typecomplete_len237_score17_06_NODE_526_length_7839_cov_99_241251_g402_i06971407